jgi:bifunctional DNase/RNase
VLIEVTVESLTLDRATQSPVVLLREEGGERALPIWIGAGEASAIHMQLTNFSVGRPLTHDLIVSAIKGLGAVLRRVVITRVEQNTYFAQLELELDGRDVVLDARPSDSIAVALRTESPIYAEESLLDLVRIEVQDATDEPPSGEPTTPEEPPAHEGEGMSANELQEYLRKMNPEDFGRFNP